MHGLLAALTRLALAPAAAMAQESRYCELAKGDYPHDAAAAPTGNSECRWTGYLRPASRQDWAQRRRKCAGDHPRRQATPVRGAWRDMWPVVAGISRNVGSGANLQPLGTRKIG
jgi:hypothetical protein